MTEGPAPAGLFVFRCGRAGTYDPAIARYRLPLRRPDDPPDDVISRLDDELPSVTVCLESDQSAVVFLQDAASTALLEAKVTAALPRVCAKPGEHFILPT